MTVWPEDLIVKAKVIVVVNWENGFTCYFNDYGLAAQPKTSVTFTEKRRLIFSINKLVQKKG